MKKHMTRNDWIINIENASEMLSPDVVKSVFEKYRAICIEDLPERYFPEVWGELSFMAEDS